MKSLLIWMWLAQSADIASSCYAINSGRFTEGNLFLPKSCKNITLTKIGVSSAITFVAVKNNDSKAAKIGISIIASTSSVAATINIYNFGKN